MLSFFFYCFLVENLTFILNQLYLLFLGIYLVLSSSSSLMSEVVISLYLLMVLCVLTWQTRPLVFGGHHSNFYSCGLVVTHVDWTQITSDPPPGVHKWSRTSLSRIICKHDRETSQGRPPQYYWQCSVVSRSSFNEFIPRDIICGYAGVTLHKNDYWGDE